MASSNDVFSVAGGRHNIGVGATVAAFFQPIEGQVSWLIKNLSGGTLEIFGATMTVQGVGTTLPASDLVSLSGTGYLMGAAETLAIGGPACFYLSSLGATSVLTVLRGKTAGK